FIAISFILSNPPLADIAPPTLADGIDVADTEGIVESQWKGGTYTLELNQTEIDVILGLGIRDNVDAEGANMIVTVWKYGELEQSLANGTAIEQTQAQADFDAFNGTWLRGNKVAPHSQDIGMAFDLGTLSVNEYKIRIHLWEDGDPWDVNEWEREYTLKLVMSSTA
ncbi:MAG: hypothetical protein GY914_09175, partial [Prochlorococcus sp.]|nr:hypothetical protein [Prochlorococcus sp.]